MSPSIPGVRDPYAQNDHNDNSNAQKSLSSVGLGVSSDKKNARATVAEDHSSDDDKPICYRKRKFQRDIVNVVSTSESESSYDDNIPIDMLMNRIKPKKITPSRRLQRMSDKKIENRDNSTVPEVQPVLCVFILEHLDPAGIRDLGDDEKQKLCIMVGMDHIFPSKFDFRQACSCRDCYSKMKELLYSEAELMHLQRLVSDLCGELIEQQHICSSLHYAALWTIQMTNLLHKKFKAAPDVSQDDDVQLQTLDSTSKLEDACRKLHQLLVDRGVVTKFENFDEDFYDENYDVLKFIEDGKYDYEQTNTNNNVELLIQQIAEIETQHQDDKRKFDQEHKTTLPPSTSINYIQQQIQLVNQLPVDELIKKAKEVTDNMKSHSKIVEAKSYLNDTCSELRLMRILFWDKHSELLEEHRLNDLDQALNQDQIMAQEHNSNGVDQTLDSLIHTAKTHKKRWEEKFAGLFGSYDRYEPKTLKDNERNSKQTLCLHI